MRTLGISILLSAAILAFAQQPDPAKTLFDVGVGDEASGRLDRAKLNLLTLASTYDDTPFTTKAKVEIGAIYVFEEAQAQMRSGQPLAAYRTFRTVTRAYPESPLAKLASDEMGRLDPDGKWKRR